MQGLGIPAWSFAKLAFLDSPIMEERLRLAHAGEEFNRDTALSDADEVQMAHALVHALWILSFADDAWSCLTSWAGRGFVPDSAGLGLLSMDCEWRADCRWAATLDSVMVQGTRAALIGHMARPTSKHPVPLPIDGPDLLRPAGSTRFRYSKLMLLIAEVEAQVDSWFSSFDVLKVVDAFAGASERNWLKVAGDDKSYVLEACVRRRGLREGEFALEFGSFVGYTTIRLGELHRRVGHCDRGPYVISLERDATHVNIARHLLDLARLRGFAEVQVGLLPLCSPRSLEDLGARSAGFSFMDHKGTRFHEDFSDLAALALPSSAASLLTDNTLNPGSPGLLWCLSRGGCAFTIECWSLGEFAHDPPVEDWQCLSDVLARPAAPLAAWDPADAAAAASGSRVWAGSSKTVFECEPWRTLPS